MVPETGVVGAKEECRVKLVVVSAPVGASIVLSKSMVGSEIVVVELGVGESNLVGFMLKIR